MAGSKSTTKGKTTARASKTKAPGSAAPAAVQKKAAKVREAEHEAEVTAMMADSAHIDRETAEKEADKPAIYSTEDMGGTQSAEEASKAADEAREEGVDREDRERIAGEAADKVAELTKPDDADEEADDLGLRGDEPAPSRVPPDPVQPRSDMTPEELEEARKAGSRGILSSHDLFGGSGPMSDTERKIHGSAKAFEGESDTERKLRLMGLTGPGH